MKNVINTGGVLLSLTMFVLIFRPVQKEETISFYKPEGAVFEWNTDVEEDIIEDMAHTVTSTTGLVPYHTMLINHTDYISWENIKDKSVRVYVEKYYKLARYHQEKYGILASITLAQGIIESASGTSELAKKGNNHFGMKCKECMRVKGQAKGHNSCIRIHDDHSWDRFISFSTAEQSFMAHTRLLCSDRYSKLRKHEFDYVKWAHGLKRAGYATNPHYAQALIQVIERYNLMVADG